MTSCTVCYFQCATCSQANTCLTCFSVNAIPNTLTGIGCICNSGYYLPSPSSVVCQTCPADCLSCSSGSTCTECKIANSNPTPDGTCACPTNSTLTGASCICDAGYTISYDGSSNLYLCVACDISCSTCIGSLSTDCLTCTGNVQLNSTTGACTVCSAGEYFSTYACHNCSSECSACSSYSFCLACSNPSKFVNTTGQCNLNCGPGKVLLSDWCYDCVSLCEVCTDTASCTTCVDHAILDNDTCSCGAGYEAVNNTCLQSYFSATLSVSLVKAIISLFSASRKHLHSL